MATTFNITKNVYPALSADKLFIPLPAYTYPGDQNLNNVS